MGGANCSFFQNYLNGGWGVGGWGGAYGFCSSKRREDQRILDCGGGGGGMEGSPLFPPSPTSEESNSLRPREELFLYFETIGGLLVVGTCFCLREAQCATSLHLRKKMKVAKLTCSCAADIKCTSLLFNPGCGK